MHTIFRSNRLSQLLMAAAAVLSGSHAWAADAQHGGDLAKRWCAACHLVASGQKQATRRPGGG